MFAPLVVLIALFLTGCGRGSNVSVNGKVVPRSEIESSVGEMNSVMSADPESLKGVEAKTEMGKVMKETMVSAAKIDKEHESRLAKISMEDVFSGKQFESKAALQKAIREMDELAKIETDFIQKKIALSETYQSSIDLPGFREEIERTRGKLQTLLKKELAFSEANKKYLSFGLKVRPKADKSSIYWPQEHFAEAVILMNDASEKLDEMAKCADEMETRVRESKGFFGKEATK